VTFKDLISVRKAHKSSFCWLLKIDFKFCLFSNIKGSIRLYSWLRSKSISFAFLMSWSIFISKCKHPYKDYNQFCQDCNALVCGTCFTLIDLHKGHRTGLIDQFAYEQKRLVILRFSQ
jgi:hypothetical protein